jgi:1-deoxy-D-xylulose-5-phosphate reductoisomerase
MAAIVGAAGLLPTLAAAKKGKRILLANKEALVMAGDLFMSEVKKNRVELLPIDSEHNAIYQCLPDANLANAQYRGEYQKHGVVEILLTASGGPFREWPLDGFEHITAQQACAHPNWVMGRKISVDSATMMNKGLEVIEAHYLFGLEPSRIQVLIHPQSLIHSMVRYNDGSVLAQLGQPDMKTPIAYGLAWPNRIDSGVKPLDFASISDLQFQALDHARYPCLNLAYQAMQIGGTMPAILNAANEVAVDQFLSGRIRFTDIHRIVSQVMESVTHTQAVHLDDILESDRQAREAAVASIKQIGC